MRIFSKKFTPISVNLKVAMRFFYVFEKQWNSSLFLYLIYRGRSILPLSLIKFSRQAEKASANFFRRENTRCTFSSRRHLCFRLGRPTPYIPSHHFFNIYKAPSSHQVSLPTILPHIFLFLFSISPPSSRLSPFRTSNSNLISPLSQFPPLLPSCCRFSNQQAKRET